MTEAIIVALISGGLTLIGVIVTNGKAQAAADARQEERIKALDRRFEERMRESNRRIDELAAEVREHNGYARRMPVVEEQIKVVNHRLNDLERK